MPTRSCPAGRRCGRRSCSGRTPSRATCGRACSTGSDSIRTPRKALIGGERRFNLERQLQDRLVAEGVPAFRRLRWDLTYIGKEVACGRGRIDLLYRRGTGRLGHDVVVELKRGRVGRAAVDQVLRYRDVLDARRPRLGRGTRASLVGETIDDDARRLVRWTSRLTFIRIAELQGSG